MAYMPVKSHWKLGSLLYQRPPFTELLRAYGQTTLLEDDKLCMGAGEGYSERGRIWWAAEVQ